MNRKETRKELERIIAVFQNYIHASTHLDIVWSEKAGYIYLDLTPFETGQDPDAYLMETGEELFEKLFSEISLDVFELTGNEDGLPGANPLEIAELKRRLEPFLIKLPEYRPLAEQLLSSKGST